MDLGIKNRHNNLLLSLCFLLDRSNPECDFVTRCTQIRFQYPELLDESEKLSRQSREGRVRFCILATITVNVGIGQLLPHGYPSVSAVDTSSDVTRASPRNQVKADHTVERKEGSLTKGNEK